MWILFLLVLVWMFGLVAVAWAGAYTLVAAAVIFVIIGGVLFVAICIGNLLGMFEEYAPDPKPECDEGLADQFWNIGRDTPQSLSTPRPKRAVGEWKWMLYPSLIAIILACIMIAIMGPH